MTDTAPAYRAVIRDYDGTTRTQEYTAAEADALIETHLLEDEVTPAGDRSGKIVVARTITGHRSAHDTRPVPLRMTITLTPIHAPRLTARQFDDLLLIRNQEDDSFGATLDGGRIAAGFVSISPSSTRRLMQRGWVSVTPWQEFGKPVQLVTVSYAGRIAMALYSHRTSITIAPLDKWVTDALGGGEYVDGGSQYCASCSCGDWRTGLLDVREVARGRARDHRYEQLRALFNDAA
jgi:hypothetical protein